MSDAELIPVERELVEVADRLARAVYSYKEMGPFWVEDLIPPMSEDDVLSSALYAGPGNPEPAAGFTLWHGNRAYRVSVSIKEM